MAELTLKERMRKLAQHGSAGPSAFHLMQNGGMPNGLANQGVLANELLKGVSLKHTPAPPNKKGEEDDEPEISTMLKRVTLRPTMNKTESMRGEGHFTSSNKPDKNLAGSASKPPTNPNDPMAIALARAKALASAKAASVDLETKQKPMKKKTTFAPDTPDPTSSAAETEADAKAKAEAEAAAQKFLSSWEMCFTSNGKPYWFNFDTGASSWTKPDGLVEKPPDEEPKTAEQVWAEEAAAAEAAADGTDAATGADHVMNADDDAGAADGPTEEDSTLEDAEFERIQNEAMQEYRGRAGTLVDTVAEVAVKQWEERYDPATGHTYYYNHVSHVSTWERPAALDAMSIMNEGSSAWQEGTDLGGKHFFVNTRTRVTSWAEPEPMGTDIVLHGERANPHPFAALDDVSEAEEGAAGAAAEEVPPAPAEDPMSPPGGLWEERIDEASGVPYYWNKKRGSQWAKPDENGDSGARIRTISSQWVVKTDNDSGYNYFFNNATGQAVWDEPAAHKRHSKSIDSSEGNNPEIWEEKLDKTSGCLYYVDPVSGVSQWEKPIEGTGGGREGSGIRVRTISSAQRDTSAGANPWVVKHDHTQNADYWYNVITTEAVWEKPEGAP